MDPLTAFRRGVPEHEYTARAAELRKIDAVKVGTSDRQEPGSMVAAVQHITFEDKAEMLPGDVGYIRLHPIRRVWVLWLQGEPWPKADPSPVLWGGQK